MKTYWRENYPLSFHLVNLLRYVGLTWVLGITAFIGKSMYEYGGIAIWNTWAPNRSLLDFIVINLVALIIFFLLPELFRMQVEQSFMLFKHINGQTDKDWPE